MSVYARFKRGPEGFRALVELLESTPPDRRKRMIDVGMVEDAGFTERALKFVLTWEDICTLPDLQLAEVLAIVPARTIAFSLVGADPKLVKRFLANVRTPTAKEIDDYIGATLGAKEIEVARIKLIEVARRLERKGLVRVKQIPATLS